MTEIVRIVAGLEIYFVWIIVYHIYWTVHTSHYFPLLLFVY